ncbi:MAG: DUF3826 domain-containing protein [Bacteroidales bacterium]|nr:DUF3826 domain-containing protein [Bacteroidales bacterium]
MNRFLSIFLLVLACTLYNNIYAQTIEIKSDGRDVSYVASITSRSEKNIAGLELAEPARTNVRNLVINRYFELNDIYAERDTLINQAKRNLTGDARNQAIEAARAACDSKLYRSHFAFPANLGIYLNHEQIIAIFDAMTYDKVQVTYDAYCDMIPSLTDEEKAQLYAWLCEARDLAIDAESSNKKHEVFNKYKGRINNYLSARGYNITEERKAWEERVKARGGSL